MPGSPPSRPLWIGSTLALAVLALGLVGLDTSLTQQDQLRGEPEAVQGQRLLARAFPAGTSAPASVIVPPGGDVDAVKRAIARLPDDVAVGIQRKEQGDPGRQLGVLLCEDPLSEAAVSAIPRLRAAVHEARAAGARRRRDRAVVRPARGGRADNLVIPPLTLAVVLLVLVALGVDDMIFLMARAREEAERQGTRALVVLTQLGTVVALGVLLVRSVLVPALVHDIGDRVWAPSALARRDAEDDRALRPVAQTR